MRFMSTLGPEATTLLIAGLFLFVGSLITNEVKDDPFERSLIIASDR